MENAKLYQFVKNNKAPIIIQSALHDKNEEIKLKNLSL